MTKHISKFNEMFYSEVDTENIDTTDRNDKSWEEKFGYKEPKKYKSSIKNPNRELLPTVLWKELTSNLKKDVLNLKFGSNESQDFLTMAVTFVEVMGEEGVKNFGRNIKKYKTLSELKEAFKDFLLDYFLRKNKLGYYKYGR